jgi:hypothetical protein
MKKTVLLISIVSLLFSSCVEEKLNPKISIDENAEKKIYGEKITVTPMDESVTIKHGKLVLAPKVENSVYTISGYFKGQVIVNTKNTDLQSTSASLMM